MNSRLIILHKLILFDSTIRLLDLAGKELSQVEAIDKQWPSGAFGEGYLVCKNRSEMVCYSVRD